MPTKIIEKCGKILTPTPKNKFILLLIIFAFTLVLSFLGQQDKLEDVPELSISKVNFPAKAFYLLSAIGLCVSSSDARRQIQGGAVRIDCKNIVDPKTLIEESVLSYNE